MERLRRIAFVILFAGWMLPSLLAQQARERAVRAAPAPAPRSHIERLGVTPATPPAPADRAVTMLRTTAAVWFLIALVYACVLTVRFRRTVLS
jgi:hypothetical protein